jgi:predicted ATPase
LALVDETIKLVASNGAVSYMPELLRMKGSLLLAMPQPRIDEAEVCFTQSLELSRTHGSRAWELRTAIDLAALWAGQGRSKDARALLRPVFGLFTEGKDLPDLKAAERVLATSS